MNPNGVQTCGRSHSYLHTQHTYSIVCSRVPYTSANMEGLSKVLLMSTEQHGVTIKKDGNRESHQFKNHN